MLKSQDAQASGSQVLHYAMTPEACLVNEAASIFNDERERYRERQRHRRRERERVAMNAPAVPTRRKCLGIGEGAEFGQTIRLPAGVCSGWMAGRPHGG